MHFSPEGEVEGIVEELSSILLCDPRIVRVFVLSLFSKDELSEEEVSRLAGSQGSDERIADKLLDLGLFIRGRAGYLPLHPRLAIRLALEKNEEVRKNRQRIDEITAMLVKRREEVQGWESRKN